MKLWLDDERDPRTHGCPDYLWVKNPLEAIDIIRTGKVTHISLDHDLGHFVRQTQNYEGLATYEEVTGYTVAKEIESLAFFKLIPRIKRMKCHSQNVVGKQKIHEAFRNAIKYWSQSPTG